VRYRIVAVDNGSRSVTVPYAADDPQPNFAYFVYNGVPSWTGDGVTYSSEVLTSLPVYHLLSRAIDVNYCQWNEGYDPFQWWDDGKYHFVGTLVYDGKSMTTSLIMLAVSGPRSGGARTNGNSILAAAIISRPVTTTV
jgi:hypothetical protein